MDWLEELSPTTAAAKIQSSLKGWEEGTMRGPL